VALGLEMLLEGPGFRLTPLATSATTKAVEFAEAHRPVLALVDVCLVAGACGLAAGREMAHRFGISVICPTGHAQPGEAAEAAAWLVRPFDPRRLLDAADAVIARQEAARTAV
jgi:DNA-binding NtrC family response regulator